MTFELNEHCALKISRKVIWMWISSWIFFPIFSLVLQCNHFLLSKNVMSTVLSLPKVIRFLNKYGLKLPNLHNFCFKIFNSNAFHRFLHVVVNITMGVVRYIQLIHNILQSLLNIDFYHFMLIDGAQFCSTKQNIDTSATYKIRKNWKHGLWLADLKNE